MTIQDVDPETKMTRAQFDALQGLPRDLASALDEQAKLHQKEGVRPVPSMADVKAFVGQAQRLLDAARDIAIRQEAQYDAARARILNRAKDEILNLDRAREKNVEDMLVLIAKLEAMR